MNAVYDVVAPAKLNLFLHVIGRRADGYHLLQSVFVLLDWCDTLHLERRRDGRLARHDLGAALPADDLSLRAATALQRASGTTFGADISIDKQLPWGAGLGGGSSDAASTLLALNRLWQLDWPRTRLMALGATIGADVPFFIGGHNAFVEGIGEQLTPIAFAPQWLAVVKPPSSIETRAIFNSPLMVRDTKSVMLAGLLADTDCFFESAHNDLQAAAEAACSEVTEAALLLKQRFGNSRMTGSGSAVFARAGRIEGGGAERRPEAPMPDLPAPRWVGRMCRSLEQHPLVGWAVEG